MEYRKMKRNGFNVSVIGLGCEHLINRSAQEVDAVVKTALENGVNILDLFMPQPEVRDNISKALTGLRDKVYMQGHLGTIMEDGQGKRSRDLEKCRLSFEDYLRRYKTDYVDIGMVHFVDTEEDFKIVFEGGLYEYAMKLKEQGVIRSFGISSHEPTTALKAVKNGYIDVLMFSINPAYDMLAAKTDVYDFFKDLTYQNGNLYGVNKDRAALYAACEEHGVSITVMKALGAGQLLNEKSSPFGKALTVPQCIHYALSQPSVCSALIGCVTPEEVLRAVSYTSVAAAERDFSGVLSRSPKYSMTGRCMYCNHCLPCPSHIDVAAVTKYLYLAKETHGNNVPDTIRDHYSSLKNSAKDCIQCGSCESNCPFGVKVIENMKEAIEIFGK
ncbi:MAG TPA: aldo/keto reductase [Candidatus Nitrosocosmicus sp.]|nr:aldo/keto reductase [Candidatus Nitrosocosmicus sp.]